MKRFKAGDRVTTLYGSSGTVVGGPVNSLYTVHTDDRAVQIWHSHYLEHTDDFCEWAKEIRKGVDKLKETC